MLLGGIFSFENNTGFYSGGAGRGGYNSTWGLPQAEERSWTVSFHICCAAIYQWQQQREGIAEEAAVLHNFTQGNNCRVQCGNYLNEQTGGAWEALFATSEADSSMILSQRRASKLLPRQALGTPSCAETSLFRCELTTASPSCHKKQSPE